MHGELLFRCDGVDPGALIERALASGFPSAELPTVVKVDRKPRVLTSPWTDVVRDCDDLRLNWGEWGERASLDWNRKWNKATLRRESFEFSPESVLALIRAWPFEACFTDPVHLSWLSGSGYRSIHGWAFALKGAGHRLYSPRIRDRGPWRILRDEEHDVTMFQFHDLDAPAELALEQARPGHALLAPSWLGGHYVGHPLLFRNGVEAAGYKPSFYDSGSRTSIVLVQDREVSAEEMGVAAATRVHQIYPEPVEQVAFVYMDEATARRQLPALWLYGLEVRAMTVQGERRIDLDYEPPPPPELPAWVQRLGTAPRAP
jgi:hypothetical protein